MSLVMIATVSCKMENRKHLELKLAAKELNRDYPADCDGIGMIDSVAFNAPDFTFYITLYEDPYKISDLRKHADGIKRGMMYKLMATYTYDTEGPIFINKLIDADANIKYVFSNENADEKDDKIEMIITTDDLLQVKNTDVTESKEQLQLRGMLCTQDLGMPMTLDEYTTMDSCRLVDNVLTYYCTVNDNDLDFGAIRQAIPEIKKELKAETRQVRDEPLVNRLLKITAVSTNGLRYRYIGATSGQTADVTLTVKDLEDILMP